MAELLMTIGSDSLWRLFPPEGGTLAYAGESGIPLTVRVTGEMPTGYAWYLDWSYENGASAVLPLTRTTNTNLLTDGGTGVAQDYLFPGVCRVQVRAVNRTDSSVRKSSCAVLRVGDTTGALEPLTPSEWDSYEKTMETLASNAADSAEAAGNAKTGAETALASSLRYRGSLTASMDPEAAELGIWYVSAGTAKSLTEAGYEWPTAENSRLTVLRSTTEVQTAALQLCSDMAGKLFWRAHAGASDGWNGWQEVSDTNTDAHFVWRGYTTGEENPDELPFGEWYVSAADAAAYRAAGYDWPTTKNARAFVFRSDTEALTAALQLVSDVSGAVRFRVHPGTSSDWLGWQRLNAPENGLIAPQDGASACTIGIYGASIAAGCGCEDYSELRQPVSVLTKEMTGLSQDYTWYSYSGTRSWAAQLSAHLGEHYTGFTVTNYAVPGTSPYGCGKCLTCEGSPLSTDVDAAIILLGNNGRNSSYAVNLSGYREILSAFPEKTKIFLLTPTPDLRTGSFTLSTYQIRMACKAAGEEKGITCPDLFREIYRECGLRGVSVAYKEGETSFLSGVTPANLHPTQWGHDLLFRLICGILGV